MAIHTFDPTPIEGGTFDHSSERFDWCALTDTKFLIIYQQINPAKMFAQVVNFSGTTSAPSFGTAYVVSTVNINKMVPVVISMSGTQAIVAYNNSVKDPTVSSNHEVTAISLNIDGSDVVTVSDTLQLQTATVRFKTFDIAKHPTTTRFRFIYQLTTSYTTTETFNVDGSGIITQVATATNYTSAKSKTPISLFPSSSTETLFARTQDGEVNAFASSANNVDIIRSNVTFARSEAMIALTDDILVGGNNTGLLVLNEPDGVNHITFPDALSIKSHYALRLDDEHVMFTEGQLSAGTSVAHIFRITNEGGFAYIANENNPITITNSVISVTLADSANRQSLYHNTTNNLVHMTGIVDDTGTKVIGFHIFSPS